MSKEQTPYLTYADLKRINASSVALDRNRNLWFDELPIEDDGTLYPVTFSMIHNDEGDVRTRIVLNSKGDTAMLDMSFEEFNGLKSNRLSWDARHIWKRRDGGLETSRAQHRSRGRRRN